MTEISFWRMPVYRVHHSNNRLEHVGWCQRVDGNCGLYKYKVYPRAPEVVGCYNNEPRPLPPSPIIYTIGPVWTKNELTGKKEWVGFAILLEKDDDPQHLPGWTPDVRQ